MVELKFSISVHRDIQRRHGLLGQTIKLIPSKNVDHILNVEVMHKWSAWSKEIVSLPLSKQEYEFLVKNIPENTYQLMTVLVLAGANHVWTELEDKVVGQYNQFNEHQGTLAYVGREGKAD
jgi:hypothetical protein